MEKQRRGQRIELTEIVILVAMAEFHISVCYLTKRSCDDDRVISLFISLYIVSEEDKVSIKDVADAIVKVVEFKDEYLVRTSMYHASHCLFFSLILFVRMIIKTAS
jgi:hypothetical protein